jgi:hypothetical protein
MLVRKLVWLLLAVLLSVPAMAQTLRDGHPDRYVVQKGDTLWHISARFLDDPWFWPEIWHNNPEIRNPHLIYPGDVISLIYVDGKPRLTVHREDRAGEVVKLSPKARELPIDAAIPTIPMEAIRPFLNRTRVVDEDVLARAPYVIAGADERVMSGSNDQIYVRGIGANPEETHYAIVRQGSAYIDPDTNKTLGFEALHVGTADLSRIGDVATLRVKDVTREVLPGDRLLPVVDRADRTHFFPAAPKTPIEGKIISVVDGVSQIGQYSVVVLNRGSEHGLEEGNVLAVYQAGRTVRDPHSGKWRDTVTLPEERAGELIVFRAHKNLSFGLVMEATRAMHTKDAVRNP